MLFSLNSFSSFEFRRPQCPYPRFIYCGLSRNLSCAHIRMRVIHSMVVSHTNNNEGYLFHEMDLYVCQVSDSTQTS